MVHGVSGHGNTTPVNNQNEQVEQLISPSISTVTDTGIERRNIHIVYNSLSCYG